MTKTRNNLRDDFPPHIREKAAKRVGYLCSHPDCHKLTIGAAETANDATASVGIAAHVCAAAPGGPRYDTSMTAEERKSIDNCIWLCGSHSIIIDRDPVKYPKELLRQWKQDAETYAAYMVESQKNILEEIQKNNFDIVDTDKNLQELIVKGQFSMLKALIKTISSTNTDIEIHELLQYYEIVTCYYCDRAVLSKLLSEYLSHSQKKYINRLVTLFAENLDEEYLSIAVAHCDDPKLQSISKNILQDGVEGTIIFRDIESFEEDESIKIAAPSTLISKLVTNYALEKGIIKILNSDKTEAGFFIGEFHYEIRVKVRELQKRVFSLLGLEDYPFAEDKEFAYIVTQLDKLKALDPFLQEPVWNELLHLSLEDEESFDLINRKCPQEIKELKRIKPLSLKHSIVSDIDSVSFDEVRKCCDDNEDYSIAVAYLARIGIQDIPKALLIFESHKYLLAKDCALLSLFVDFKRKAKSNFSAINLLLEYNDIYEEDFVYRCLRARVVAKNKKHKKLFKKDVNWLLDFTLYGRIPYTSIISFIDVLDKAKKYAELSNFDNTDLPIDFRMRIAASLQNTKDRVNVENALEIYESIVASKSYKVAPQGLYGSMGVCAHLLDDYSSAKRYYKEEFLYYPTDSIVNNLLGLRYETLDWLDDEVLTYAKKSTNSRMLQMAGAFCIELEKYSEARFYFLKALLVDDKDIHCIIGYFSQKIQASEKTPPVHVKEGTVAKLVSVSETIFVALHSEEQLQGITPNRFAKCWHYTVSADEISDLHFREKDEEAVFRGKSYIIEDIMYADVVFTSYAMSRLMKSDHVQAVRGKTPEAAAEELFKIVKEGAKETKRIIDVYNESEQILPLSLFSRNLGKNFLETQEFLVNGNKEKVINNPYIVDCAGKTIILSADAIYMICALNIRKEALSNVNFTCPLATRNLLLNEIKKMQADINNPNAGSYLYVVDGKVGMRQPTSGQKRNELKFLRQLKEFIVSVPSASQLFNYAMQKQEMRALFSESKLYVENDMFGFLDSIDNSVLLTDNRFLFTVAHLDGKESMGMNAFLNMLDLSAIEHIDLIEKLAKMNYVNYFPLSVYNRIKERCSTVADDAEARQIAEKLQELFLSNVFDEHAEEIEHNDKVMWQLTREVLNRDNAEADDFFGQLLRDCVMHRFARNNPEKYKAMTEDAIKRMRVRVTHEGDKAHLEVGFIEKSDDEMQENE